MAADERQNMKLRTVLALVAVVCSFSASAQVAPHPPFVIDTGPNHRTWQSTRLATDESGQSTLRPSTFVEVASGLNYQDESGIWRASGDLIELADDGGAVALQGPIKVRFNGNLNVPGAISLTTVSNRVFRAHPIGLYYFAADTGQSALIARVMGIRRMGPAGRSGFTSSRVTLASVICKFDGRRAALTSTPILGTIVAIQLSR